MATTLNVRHLKSGRRASTMRPMILAVLHSKGGVGRSTTVWQLGVELETGAGPLREGNTSVSGLKPFMQESLEVVDILLQAEVLDSQTIGCRSRQVHMQVRMPVRRDRNVKGCRRVRDLHPFADSAQDARVGLQIR